MRGVALLSILLGCLPAAPTNRLTPEAIVSMRTVQGTAIRPNGNEVLYVVTERPIHSPDPANTEIWMSDGASEKRLTNNPGADFGPQWSPSGDRFAFLSNRPGDNGNQLYSYEIGNGKATKITKLDDPVVFFAGLPMAST